MEVKIDEVELVMDKDVTSAKSGQSGYVYIPSKYVGRRVKICIMEGESKEQ